jgi:hypothetical protein
MEVNGQFHAPAALPQEKNPWHPLHRRLGRPQSQFVHYREEKNLLPLSRIELLFYNHPAHSPPKWQLQYEK